MKIEGLPAELHRLDTPLPIWRGHCPAEQWRAIGQAVIAAGGRLVSLWGSQRGPVNDSQGVVAVAYATGQGLLWLELQLAGGVRHYPDLSDLFAVANRLQRAVADLSGLFAEGASDTRPWLRHNAWPADFCPLRDLTVPAPTPSGAGEDYAFVRVEGDGVHEIAVGPVHAGIIEPGHFRFSVVGEKVLRLEERLGYKHKGIDRRFTELPAGQGHQLAGRVSGDSTVAYAWAYCMALETIRATTVSPRAAALRGVLLERERVANHLGDLGALGNDAAFGFGLAQFMRLKEDWLRLNKTLFGHRFLMDRIVPGGVAGDLDAAGVEQMRRQCECVEKEVKALRSIYDDHSGLQDRFITTGRVTPKLAAQLGLTGFAGRASGIANDLRADFALPPYAGLGVRMATHRNGDVAARVTVRFEETLESLRLIRALIEELPGGEVVVPLASPAGGKAGRNFGIGWSEGWRGEILVALETEGELIRRCHCHDPSWQNWPVLEHAIMGNIVPDFPLINKSFNLSYAGHDR
jgi:Ni,Fe-hydrogenase III large subunit/Ni,Fe-hydrogenase III component G